MKNNRPRRPVSFGTIFMLTMLALVLIGSAAVLGLLSSGGSVDLSKLNMQALNLQTAQREGGDGGEQNTASARTEPQDVSFPEGPGGKAEIASNGTAPTATAETTNPERQEAVSAGKAPAAPQAGGESEPEQKGFTLTVGGSVCAEGEVLKNAWSADAKTYDFSDMMQLLKPELKSDLNAVFIENILSDGQKANDTVAPEALADLLQEAGFRAAACGYSKAYDKGLEGIGSTWMALDERGIIPTGIRPEERQDRLEILTVNGVKTAFLQYTATVPSKTRKKMEKADAARTVPEAEISLISEEIDEARAQGAEAVIVLLKWGKTDSRPDAGQRELAGQIARAGADLIIGSGSRIAQSAEYLEGRDGGRVLCVWSLGTLLTGDRSNPTHMGGYLLHVTIRSNGRGGADVLAPEYSPVYTWKYKQDGRYYYRCLASDQPAPDGMDSEQQKVMARALSAVSDTLAASPVSLRER